MEIFGAMATDYGPVWALVSVMGVALAWLVREQQARHRELRELLQQVLEERAQSRLVIQQLTAAVRNLSQRISRADG